MKSCVIVHIYSSDVLFTFNFPYYIVAFYLISTIVNNSFKDRKNELSHNFEVFSHVLELSYNIGNIVWTIIMK